MSPRTSAQYQEIREEKKALIANAALELFANEGYHTTSISKIAQKAGVSKGLLYNYFEGKEDLLAHIFSNIMNRTMDMLDPNHDNEISEQEADEFMDRFFDVLTSNPEEWRLFYQLSVQPDVMKLLVDESWSDKVQHNQKMLLDFFAKQHFKDPELAIVLFSSVFKGFTLMYAFAPDMFSDDLISRVKVKMRELFIRPRPSSDAANIPLDEKLAYFLL